jgi:DNA-binding NtrC family response regulator
VLRQIRGSKPSVGFILLYEDDQAIRDVVAEVLRDEGHQVLVCTTLQAVQSVARADPTALALVDTWGSGFLHLDEGARQDIRGFAQRIPTIMLTAHVWAQETPADELGLLALLRMPLDLEQLLETVGQHSARLGTGSQAVRARRQQLARRSTMALARLGDGRQRGEALQVPSAVDAR